MSTAREIKKIVCVQCYTVLDVGDNFCRQCGLVTASGPAGISGTKGRIGPQMGPSQGRHRPGWSESPAVVLTALFFLLGPLALPMLWRSRRFSQTWKIALTVVVGVLTVVILWQLWLIWNLVMEALRPLQELQMF